MPDYAHLKLHDQFVALTDMKLYASNQLFTSICFCSPRKANLWLDIIYQLLDRYLRPDPVWHWDCAFSGSIWPRDAVLCPVECFPVSPNTLLSGDSKTHINITILIISLNHWLLSLSLLSSFLPLYFQILSAWEITFFIWKLPSCFVPPSQSFYDLLYLWTLLKIESHLCVSVSLIRLQ